MEKLNQHNEEFESEALKRVGKENVFSTPEGYFDNLPLSVSDKLHEFRHGEKQPAFLNPVVFRIAAIAVVALMVMLSVYYLKPDSNYKMQADITTDDLIGTGMISEFDESLLVEIWSDSEIASTTDSSAVSASHEKMN